jgi:peptidase A4-like protein
MLRRWHIPLAALFLVLGTALATSAPASAATHPTRVAQPGGTIQHLIRPGAPASAHSGVRNQAESTNWSGYAADSGTYTSVSASWVEPTGSCTSATRYSSFWVGLDGYSSSSVEQTGTDTDCVDGSPQYYGWYETYPNPSFNFGDTINPGDTISASVTYEGGSSFEYTLADDTQGWSVSTQQSEPDAQLSSAEVIIEAPCCTASGGILPLADFGTVHMSNATVDGSAIGNTDPEQIIMVDSSGQDKDTVSSLSSGENFSATWERAS